MNATSLPFTFQQGVSEQGPAQPSGPTISGLIPTHVCHWQNCHRVFASTPELLNHVASDHLGASAGVMGSTITPASASVFPLAEDQTFHPELTTANSSNDGSLSDPAWINGVDPNHFLSSCLWDDCFPLPDCTAPAPQACPNHAAHLAGHRASGEVQQGAIEQPLSPQTMLRHVLEAHLGVSGSLLGWPIDAQGLEAIPSSGVDLPDEHRHPSHVHVHSHGAQHHHDHVPAKPERKFIKRTTYLPTPSSTDHTPSPVSSTSNDLSRTTDSGCNTCMWPGCQALPFPDSGTLMEHISDEHLGKGKDSYTCLWDGCDREFGSRQKVLRHLQSHTGHKPFVCEVCGRAFGEATPLAAHMRRHAQESASGPSTLCVSN